MNKDPQMHTVIIEFSVVSRVWCFSKLLLVLKCFCLQTSHVFDETLFKDNWLQVLQIS